MFTIIVNFITPFSLVLLNVVLILLAEFAGGGTYFIESNLIHLLIGILCTFALFFVLNFRYLQDEFFRNIFNGFLAMLVVFFSIHTFEYFGMILVKGSKEVTHGVDLFIIALYTIGLVAAVLGGEKALSLSDNIPPRNNNVFAIALLLSITSIVIIIIGIKLDVIYGSFFSVLAFLLLSAMAFLSTMVIRKILLIGEKMPLLKEFASSVTYCFIFITLATIFEFFKIFNIGIISELQITYITHFAFFIAFSFLLLGFKKVFMLGGLFKDLQDEYFLNK